MDITERIKQKRGQDTIAGILPGAASASVTDVARSFGLLESSECYEEIDAVEAAKVIENVLHRDMAYNTEIMPFSLARELSGEFVAAFAGSDARFFTNGEWGALNGGTRCWLDSSHVRNVRHWCIGRVRSGGWMRMVHG